MVMSRGAGVGDKGEKSNCSENGHLEKQRLSNQISLKKENEVNFLLMVVALCERTVSYDPSGFSCCHWKLSSYYLLTLRGKA